MDPAKQCYHCQGLGHVQADCPTLRLNGGASNGRCYSCGQVGHLAVSLPGCPVICIVTHSLAAQLPEPGFRATSWSRRWCS